ncbi:haloalkane dehalogenase [Kutzneria sp. CA-103260]|uniref:haloalkane dehalogenase n=1 Tax=Kutzneria sp. CA-103260 TaxID=2802641 RepID=UPI001BEF5778|nr:haloalkane dehalogenase [Kutzneria sp. CA-103260]QUQ65143.1 haloalkane dehalogenase [Kutzneria sp. CA-103260]
MRTIEVEDSFMAYREAGQGDTTVVFLHGNPTSSYLWRNVIPVLADRARCLAPDLIGMGDSGKPDIGYRFVDHARYLDAWFEALGLDDVVIVGQDWGGALGMDWARRHPDRVRGLALVETFLRPLSWAEMPPLGQELFRRMRSPEGEQIVLRDNQFIEFNLPHGVASGLAPADHDEYRRPYPDERSRRPLLAWPREIPFDGEPADVHDRVVAYGRWLAETPEVRKLVMTVEPGVGMGSPETAAWAKETFAAVTTVSLGPGGHQAPEDQPEAMGRAIASWLWS